MPLVSLLWAVVVSTCHGSSMAQKVTQTQPDISVRDTETVTLNCMYDTSDSNYLFWYKQPPSREMILIIRQEAYRQENATNNRFSVNFQKGNKSFSLRISDSRLEDAATYFCACNIDGGSSYGKLTFGQGTFLTVHPNVQDPDPSVYQMRSPKTGRTVCLFTDFDSQADFQKPEGATVISLNSTVLDMKVMDSKSNGALTWNSETNIECKENFQQPFYPSSNYSCDAKLIEKSFETDMDLNFYNLLVIGLRILLLKVIGFNLFMTLRLWSC